MARLAGRDYKGEETPLSDHATGEYFRVPRRRGVWQRYDKARSAEPAHWYLLDTGWHVFLDEDVTAAKQPRGKQKS